MPENENLTLEQKVAKLEQAWNTSPDTVIPAKYAKLAWIIFMVLSMLVAGWQSTAILIWGQDSKYAAISAIWVGVVAAIIRFLTTNSFGNAAKLLVVGLLGLSVLGTSACVHWNKPKLEAGLKQCAAGFVDAEVQGILPDVLKAIQGDKADWQAQLDQVLMRGGMAAICALGVVISTLESGTGGTAGAMPLVMQPPEAGGLPRAVVLLRAYSYVESRQ